MTKISAAKDRKESHLRSNEDIHNEDFGIISDRNLLNSLSTPLSIIDLRGRVLFANSAFCQLTSIPEGKVRDENYFETAHSGKRREEICRKVMESGRKASFEDSLRDKTVLTTITRLPAGTMNVSNHELLLVELALTDTSEPILKKKDERFELFFNNLTEAISLHKMITDEKGVIVDFTYEDMNPARERMTGLTFAEVKNKTVRQINPDIIDGFIERYGEAARTGKPFEFEYFTSVFSKHLKVKVFSPKFGYLATIIEDVSARKKAEELLHKTLEKYRTIFENSVEGIVVIDNTGTITEWNKCIENKSGITKANAIGNKLWDIQFMLLTNDWKKRYPVEKLENIWVRLIETLPDKDVFRAEGQFLDMEGKIVLTEDIICPINLNGERHMIILQLDLTDRLNAEQELKISEQKLIQLNSTKDKLFSIIAHDLRSPFNAILGYSRVLRENMGVYPLEESERLLDIIHSSAQNTLDLLINLLSWAKNQTGQTNFNQEVVDLKKIVLEIVELMSSSARIKNITMNYNVSGTIKVYADKNMLKIILQNLISNAVKFTKPGGIIHIYALPCPEWVEITVSDTGVGISREILKSLLSSDTNSPTEGTMNETGSGLGLAVCREFVEKNKGKIWVESKLGKGSKFNFSLPFVD